MNRAPIWIVAMTLLLACATASAQYHYQFHNNGPFANGSGCGSPCDTYPFLFVYVASVDSSTYFLSYTLFDTATGTAHNGLGNIPASAVSGTGTQLTVNLDTSTANEFTAWYCDPTGCYSGGGGVVNVTFTKTNYFTASGTNTSTEDFKSFTLTQSGQFNATSAALSGSLLGITIENGAAGELGTGNSLLVSVSRP